MTVDPNALAIIVDQSSAEFEKALHEELQHPRQLRLLLSPQTEKMPRIMTT